MTFTALIVGGGLAIKAVNEIPAQVEAAGLIGMRRAAAGGASIVRGNASGRPGPRFITGDYRRSIMGEIVSSSGAQVIAQIGTNAAQGRRLEFGFYGPDSLGRVYSQAPLPHFQPSIGEVSQLAEREVTGALVIGLAA